MKMIGEMITCRDGDMWRPQAYGGPYLAGSGLTDSTNGGSNPVAFQTTFQIA